MAININKNYKKIQKNYIFTQINLKTEDFLKNNPNIELLKLGIGDVTRPLSKNLVNIMKDALENQTSKNFKGYPPETGYDFLKNAVTNYYKTQNINLTKEDVFISNGAGCDVGNILNLFSNINVVVQDPTYPAYFDSNFLYGNKITLISVDKCNNYKMLPDNLKEDSYLIYLCSPNNPTGATLNKNDLKKWVTFALKTKSIIIFDCAYERFIEDDSPHSIYQIKDAKKCAIEIASFSKTAGFTNLRCSYTIVPKQCKVGNNSLNDMWNRRQCTYFNGVPYFVQKGAEYCLSKNGLKECQKNINYYKTNAKLLKACLISAGFEVLDTNNSPYVWIKCPKDYTSWEFFDLMLNKYHIVGVPGCGFGKCGEGYFRFSGFGKRTDVKKACEEIKKLQH